MKCLMKLKFRPYSRITFIFSWLKYEEILKTLESQVGWLSQKMALNSYDVSSQKSMEKKIITAKNLFYMAFDRIISSP